MRVARRRLFNVCCVHGEVAERFKAAVLKTAEAQASGGSNPSLSAICRTIGAAWSGRRRAANRRETECTRDGMPLRSARIGSQRRVGRCHGINLSVRACVLGFDAGSDRLYTDKDG
jgi:hypothetical protein